MHGGSAPKTRAHPLPDHRAEHARRTPESLTAERAFVDWSSAPPSERPLAAQRPALAKVLFEVLKGHGVSRQRFANMLCVDEKQVRKMLDGRAPIPMASLGVMPVDMAIDFMDRVVRLRSAEPQRAAALLRQGVAGLRSSAERANALRELLAVAAELSR